MEPNALVRTGLPAHAGILSPAEEALLADLIADSVAPATARAYLGDWNKAWAPWCAARGHGPFPVHPRALGLWIAEQAAMTRPDGSLVYAAATIERRAAAVSTVNQVLADSPLAGSSAADVPPVGRYPVVRKALAGMRRRRKDIRQARADPLLIGDLRVMCAAVAAGATTWSRRVRARRDAAVLTAMLAGAYRRSELAAHVLADVTYHPHAGLHLYVASAKNDQEGRGLVKALTFGEDPLTCPACAVLKWIDVAAAWDVGGRPALIRLLAAPDPAGHVCREPRRLPATAEPLLRGVRAAGTLMPGGLSGHAINGIIQGWWEKAGLDPARRISGHSPRAGFVTEGFRAGASPEDIARQTGQSLKQVGEYRRELVPEAGNAVTRLPF